MIGKIHYFFWSIAFSGVMLIVGVYTGNTKKMIAMYAAVRTQGANGLPTEYREKLPYVFHDVLPNFAKRKIPCHVWYNVDQLSKTKYYPDPAASSCTEKDTVANTIGPPDEHGNYAGQPPAAAPTGEATAASVKPKLPLKESTSATRSDIELGNYVQIDGKYYVKRADHVYNVNNQKVYFESNHRVVMDDKQNRITDINGDSVQASAPDVPEDQPTAAPKVARKMNAVEDGNDVPTNTDEMLKVLQKAQSNQKTEEEMLNALDREK